MPDSPSRLTAALADRYRLERELGQGGMATVYLAEDLKHRRKVAIKVLRPELAAVIGASRFLKEIETTANLQHPHILPLFDSGEVNGTVFYVMPFVEGESLRDRLTRDKQLPVSDAVRIATEVAGALDYAHRHNVIHRDIKPENILLHDGRALVADFGIALAASKAGGRMTETGMSLGTPTYMSPEQAMGEREITARSDVYALGCVTYEMLIGEPPFTGPTAQAIVAKVMTAEPASLTAQRKSIPPQVEEAVLTALEKLPADRFASAAEFAAALAGTGLTSGTGRSRAAGAPAGAGRRALITLGVALVMLAALAAWGWLRPRPVSSAGATRLMLEFPARQRPVFSAFVQSILAQSPDGSGFLYSGPGVNLRTQFWMRRWDRLQAVRLAQSVDEGCCATFSPSGDSVAYLTPPNLLQVVPLTGGISTVVADSGLTSVTDYGGGVDWGPDGRLYVSSVNGLARVSPQGGALEHVVALDTQRGDLRYLWPAVLPGAKGALVTVIPARDPQNPERAAIGVANFATGKVEIILQGLRAVYARSGHLVVVKANGVLWAVPFDARALRPTGKEHELADTAGTLDLSLTPNGTLAYMKAVVQSYQVVSVDRSGRDTPLAPDLRDVAFYSPALSPDGKRLLLSVVGQEGQAHLWVKRLGGGPRVQLTFDGTNNLRPAWQAGTDGITYGSDREEVGGLLRLFELDASGAGQIQKPVLHDPRRIGSNTWSPDGKWLVFRTDNQDPGNGDIMAIRPEGDTVARALVATPAEELAPAVSPDGRWLAYTSNESGRREVYVRPFPPTNEVRYKISTAGGITPAWNRNGRELFYLDAVGNMVSVPYAAGATFQAGEQTVLFSAARYQSNPFGRDYEVMPDGQRFLMIRGETDDATHVVVVFNFLAELERVMAQP